MVEIRAKNVSKSFGEVVAVDHASLQIDDGEFFTLLGPSGCGKTTFLRCIAGLELVDEGRVYFDDIDVTDVPPHKRGTGMVFQNYALWPHMKVFGNVAYGLKIKGQKKEEVSKNVNKALEMVKLAGLGDRTPHQLSGGQQQRVALARAVAINPKVLLFDEPLSNLDAKLRLEMRAELKKLQRDLGITTTYVTHDQEEAMSISDRIAVMDQGKIMQVGTPRDIYQNPQNEFVAQFIGQGTFLDGKSMGEVDGFLEVELTDGKRIRAVPSDPTNPPEPGDSVLVLIRPEEFVIGEIPDGNRFECEVYHISFLGDAQRIRARGEAAVFVIESDPDVSLQVGDQVTISSRYDSTLAVRLGR